MWTSKRMRFFTLQLRVQKGIKICIDIRNKKVFRDETLKEGARVRHIGASMYTQLDSSAWTSRAHRPLKIRDRIFQLIPLRPRCGNATSPEVPVVVVLTLEEISPGTPHHNTVYVAAVRPTGCCSQDI